MRILFATLALLIGASSGFAQHRFAVHNATGSTMYNTLDSALTYSVSGDTIYIPGGAFNMGTVHINKKLHLVGVGHYPDSTQATYQTTLTGAIRFITGSDGSTVQGLYLSGDILLGTHGGDMVVNSIEIMRSNVNQILLAYDTWTNNPGSSGHLISESVVRGSVIMQQAQNVLIEKSFIGASVRGFNGNLLVRNCIFVNQDGCPGYNVSGTSGVFRDNIFYNISFGCGGNPLYYSTSCTYENNLFTSNITVPSGTNIGSGNITNHPQANVFIAHTGNVFSYASSFHLNPACLGVGAASDGTDMGLYGTTNPFKPGAVPFNPHVIQAAVATQTNSTGEVNVQFKVSAQDK
jgi:hypothetical protein